MKVDAEDTVGAAFGGRGDKKASAKEKRGETQSGGKKGEGGTTEVHGLLKDW